MFVNVNLYFGFGVFDWGRGGLNVFSKLCFLVSHEKYDLHFRFMYEINDIYMYPYLFLK